MSETAFASAGELARRIRDKELSSLELTEYFIDRIERRDGEINAVVVRDFERAREGGEAGRRRLGHEDRDVDPPFRPSRRPFRGFRAGLCPGAVACVR